MELTNSTREQSLEKALHAMTLDCEAYSDAIGAAEYPGNGPTDPGPDPLHYDLWHLAEERRLAAELKAELLAALVICYEFLDANFEDYDMPDILLPARAAIARAKGEQP